MFMKIRYYMEGLQMRANRRKKKNPFSRELRIYRNEPKRNVTSAKSERIRQIKSWLYAKCARIEEEIPFFSFSLSVTYLKTRTYEELKVTRDFSLFLLRYSMRRPRSLVDRIELGPRESSLNLLPLTVEPDVSCRRHRSIGIFTLVKKSPKLI